MQINNNDNMTSIDFFKHEMLAVGDGERSFLSEVINMDGKSHYRVHSRYDCTETVLPTAQ